MGKGFSKDMGRYLGGRKKKAFLKTLADKAKNKASILMSSVDEKKDNLTGNIKSNIKKKKEELLQKKEELQKKKELAKSEGLERKKIELKEKLKLKKERLEQKAALQAEKEKFKQERLLAKAAAREERRNLKKELATQKAQAKAKAIAAQIPLPEPQQPAPPEIEEPEVQEPESETQQEPEIPETIPDPEPTPEPDPEPEPTPDPTPDPIQPETPPIPVPEATPEEPPEPDPTPQIHPDAINLLLESSKKLGERMDEIATKVEDISTPDEPLPPLSELPLPPPPPSPPPKTKSRLRELFKPTSAPSKTEQAAEDSYQDFAYEAEDDISYAGNSVSKHEPKNDWQHLQQEEINAIQYAVASGKHKEELKLNTQDEESDWKEINPDNLESFDEPVKKKKSKLFGFISVKRVSELEQEKHQEETHEEMKAASDYVKAQEVLNDAMPEEVRYNEPETEEHEDPFADLEEPKESKQLNKDDVIVVDDDYKIEVVEHK